MDSIIYTLQSWENEAVVVLVTLAGVLLFHYATKLWAAPAEAILGAILGASIGITGMILFLTRHIWGVHVGSRAFWFITLYVWCVLGMVFFLGKSTSRIKLIILLLVQAFILYQLYIYSKGVF